GIDAADWDNSGHDSLLIGNFWDEMLALYHPAGHGLYTDQAASAGLGEPSRPFTTFGCVFADLDNDGWLDIAAANGHIDEKPERDRRGNHRAGGSAHVTTAHPQRLQLSLRKRAARDPGDRGRTPGRPDHNPLAERRHGRTARSYCRERVPGARRERRCASDAA